MFFPFLNAQKLILIGGISEIANNHMAFGSSLNIGIEYQIDGKKSFSLFVGQNYMESDNFLPEDLGAANFHLRDKSNIIPIEDYVPMLWKEESFPGYSLRSKPNRYSNFFILMKYSYTHTKLNRWKFGGGLEFSYFDIMFINQVVDLEEYTLFLPHVRVEKEKSIPIFSFDSFYDIGAVIDLQYRVFSYRRLNFGIQWKVSWYPLSSNFIYSMGIVTGWKKLN